MTISLKNVDDRLKVLENKLTGSVIGFPNWSKMTKLVNGNKSDYTYTASSSCWILVSLLYPSYMECYVNGVNIGRGGGMPSTWESNNTFILPINSGDKVRVVLTRYSGGPHIWQIPVKLYYNLTVWLKGWWSKWL